MSLLKNILLPVDFSERSLEAALQAEVVARQFQAAVTVLHVVDPKENETGRFEPGGVKNRQLEKLLTHGFAEGTISRVVRDGNPVEEIVSFTSSNPVDLVMMASHAYRPFETFAFGSVAAEVHRDAHCPVWISVQADKERPPKFRKVLCAVDLGPDTKSVANWGSRFAAAFQAELSVLHVFRSLESDEPPPDCPDEWLSLTERAELDKARQHLGAPGQVLFAGGAIPEAVCRQARKLHSDLIVIGRSPKAGDIQSLRISDYIRQAPCPVVRI